MRCLLKLLEQYDVGLGLIGSEEELTFNLQHECICTLFTQRVVNRTICDCHVQQSVGYLTQQTKIIENGYTYIMLHHFMTYYAVLCIPTVH